MRASGFGGRRGGEDERRSQWRPAGALLLVVGLVGSCTDGNDASSARSTGTSLPSSAPPTATETTPPDTTPPDTTNVVSTTDSPSTTVDSGAARVSGALALVLGVEIGSAGFVEPDPTCLGPALEELDAPVRRAADRIVEHEAAWYELSGEDRYPIVAAYLSCVDPALLKTWVLVSTLRAPDHLQCLDEAWAGDIDGEEMASSLAHGHGFDDLAPDTVDELTAAALSCLPDEQWWQEDEAFLLEQRGVPTAQAECVVAAYAEVLGVEAIVQRRILTLDFVPATPDELERLDLPARCGADVPVAVIDLGVRPGDCVTGFGQGARATSAVDCAQSHNGEVVSVVDLAAESPQWPGMATLRSEAERRCSEDVGALVGNRSGYGAGWDIPDRTSWEASAHTLTCVLIKPGFASWTGPTGLVPAPSTTVVTTTTTTAPAAVVTNINEVAVGQCFVDDPGLADGDLGDELVEVVDCSIPHRFEMFHVSAMDGPAGTPYPGDEVARNTAISRCHPAFDAYVGRVWAESRLGFTYVYPADFEWDANNRRVYCLLWDRLGRTLTSSMAGSGE